MKSHASALGLAWEYRSWEGVCLGLVLGVLVLAFVGRLYLLDGQSLWADEGASVVMAGRQPLEILDHAAADIHPPLYYLLLHWWNGLAGKAEYALRFPSVAFGMGLVAVTYALGRRLLEGWAGLLGAFLAALSPFQIYYAQEARMYMPMAFFSALSFFLFLKLVQQQPVSSPKKPLWLWLAYGLASLAALYSQYFAAAILVTENLLFALLYWRFWRCVRWWGAWLLCQALIGFLYAPWLAKAWPHLSSWPAISEPLDLVELLRRVFLVFSFGLSWDATATLKTELLVLLLLAGNLLWPWISAKEGSNLSSRIKGLLATVLFLVIPILTLYLLSLRRPFYQPKFLLLASPPFLLLLGLGLLAYARIFSRVTALLFLSRGRALSPLVGTALVVLGLGALSFAFSRSTLAYYSDPKYSRDDYRGLVRTIERLKEPRDAILLNAAGQIEIFSYYHRGGLSVFPLPRQRPPDRAASEEELKAIAFGYQRLWGIYWATEQSDPEGIVEGWLNRHAFPSPTRWFGGVRLVLYQLPATATVQRQALSLRFGTSLELVGYEVQAPEPRGEGALANLAPGEVLPLTLLWRAREPVSGRYTVFTHVLDDQSLLWGQHDAEPASLPTSQWPSGELVRDNHGLPVLLGTPPGQYDIEVGLYDAVSGQRLPVFDKEGRSLGDRYILGRVSVSKPRHPVAAEDLGLRQPLLTPLGELRLLGTELGKLGAPQERAVLHPGEPAQLVLFWQAIEAPTRDHDLLLRLVDASGRTVREWRTQPLEGRYPTSRWEAGEVVRDQHKLTLDIPPGRYRLLLDVPSMPGKHPTVEAGLLEVR